METRNSPHVGKFSYFLDKTYLCWPYVAQHIKQKSKWWKTDGKSISPFDGEVYMSKDIGVSISELPWEQDDMKARPNWVKSVMVSTIAQGAKGYWFESSLAHNYEKKEMIRVVRKDGSERDVEIMYDRYSNKYCFVNLTSNHVCKCRFDSIEDAFTDLNNDPFVESWSTMVV